MEIFIGLFVFIFGLIIGSFLNVLIYRLPRGLQFFKGRSFCPKCKKKISWYDNIPQLSFILLGGKCRKCGKPISIRYPLIELLTGILFVLITSLGLSHLSALSYLSILSWGLNFVLVSGLIVIFFVDLEHQIIPDEITVPLIALFILKYLLFLFVIPCLTRNLYRFQLEAGMTQLLFVDVAPAVGSFLFFYFIYLITKKKGMGFGDVKLAFLMGLVLGFPKIIIAFYIAFLTGAFIGVILILTGKAKLKGKIAFGPFLAVSTIIILLWGENILNIIQKVFF